MAWLWAIPIVIVVLGAIALTVYVFNRDLTSGGPRATAGGTGGAFGAFTEVFDPGAHRAQLERDRLKNQVVATPSPGPDADRRARVVTDRFGNPVGFRRGTPGVTAPRDPDTPAHLPPPA